MEADDRYFEARDHDAKQANKASCRKLLQRLKEVHGQPAAEVQPDVVDLVPAVVRAVPVPEAKAEARFIRYLSDERGRRIPTVQEIKYVVAERFKITTVNIDARSRKLSFVLPRQIAIYLCRELTVRSLPDIARRFGGRDHTTAIHSVNKIEGKIASDPAFAKTISELREQLQ